MVNGKTGALRGKYKPRVLTEEQKLKRQQQQQKKKRQSKFVPRKKDVPDSSKSRALIGKYLKNYIDVSGLVQPKASYMGQPAKYEAQKMLTVYNSSVKNHLGNRIRSAVNILCRTKIRAKAIRAELGHKDRPEDEICQAIEDRVLGPARKVKDQVKYGNIVPDGLDDETYNLVKELQPVLVAYKNITLHEKGLFYDIKCDPTKHIKTFFLLSTFLKSITKQHGFQCFPLRTQWVPCHVHIDKKILYEWFLGAPKNLKLTVDLWNQVIDMKCRAITRMQGGKTFQGSIQTDGVSVSIIKKFPNDDSDDYSIDSDDDDYDNDDDSGNGDGNNSSSSKKPEFQYIHKLSKDELCQMKNNCVFIDPGRKDLLYCMHELSTADNPRISRYTRNMKDRSTRYSKFRKIREAARASYKDGIILELVQQLARVSKTTLDPDEFDNFLRVQAEVWDELDNFYSNTMTTYSNNPKPLHRQLRLASYLNSKRADELLCNQLRQVFSKDTVLVIGNWSASMSKYHELIKGVGMRRMLRDHGFQYSSSVSEEGCKPRQGYEKACQRFCAVPQEMSFQQEAPCQQKASSNQTKEE
ncbi:hypothetical protein IW140_000171 [Coemansia sp. RSA 1813]|nr:hypothetical protein LPJ74_001602 [Coemansia sp. RSA 1843]KAJ2213036.1 hypothetical protein EV179_004184 [Coemansia sp. RSA 487]KAJ2573529.1 hypothetical protein IW140_000171 [Coemansia sp. RSA 1813]